MNATTLKTQIFYERKYDLNGFRRSFVNSMFKDGWMDISIHLSIHPSIYPSIHVNIKGMNGWIYE